MEPEVLAYVEVGYCLSFKLVLTKSCFERTVVDTLDILLQQQFGWKTEQ